MKRILLLLLTLSTLSSQAQVYNNEWIDYSKTYYKFKISKDGLYRIPQSLLTSVGYGSVNADYFQLWRNGKQVPVYSSIQNAPLDASGYLEFWGEMNDGKPDNELYRLSDFQLSDKWSLQSDTAIYFLTVNPSGANLRLTNQVNNIAGNTLAPEPYYMCTAGQYERNKISSGRSEIVGTSYTYSSSYDAGEGWTSADIGTGEIFKASFANLEVYAGAGAPDPVLKINAAGNAVNVRRFLVTVNGDSILSKNMDYYDYSKTIQQFSLSKISSGTATIEITNKCDAPGDRMVVAQTELIYPRKFRFDTNTFASFELEPSAIGNYLEVTGFLHFGAEIVVYDLTNNKRYVDITNGTVLRFALLPSAVKRKLIITTQDASRITRVDALKQQSFINYGLAANQGDFIMITNSILTGASGGSDPVEEYRAYRSSPTGGSYAARVYDIDQLSDQFAFGIAMHPMSIRNFLRWARVTYTLPLKDVLVIGKGVHYIQYRMYLNPDIAKLQLVPTFGSPGSDNLLSCDGSSAIPLTPIGRLSVINKQEISDYFEKVKEYEQALLITSPIIADKAWMKTVVHVAGGSDATTSDILASSLDGFKQIIVDTFYTANVHSFVKTSSNTVEQVTGNQLANLFDEGIGLLTYFGHSSSSSLEFNMNSPENYHNQGKYPLFNVMGCNAGNFFGSSTARFTVKETLSEKYVLAKQRGAIAFMASTHLGIIHYLDIYATRMYRAMSRSKYGATFGEIMDETIRQVFSLTTENDFYARFHCEQFTLHGDPALRLYNFQKPDYAIEEQLVKINPKLVTVSDREINITAKFVNIGKGVENDIVVEVKRTFPDQTTAVVKRDTINFHNYADSLVFKIDVVPTRDKGLNRITVTIDADNEVEELYETNNSVTKDVYVIEDEVKPVYPYDYSIVNSQNLKLFASSANPFAPVREYLLEMDTTAAFNSPGKITRSVNAPGGVITFTPGVTMTDSTVYYWRVARFVSTGSPIWSFSSFQYIANSSPGFSQAHYDQHVNSTHSRIMLKDDREWLYDSVKNNLFVNNGVWGSAISQASELSVNVNDSSYIRNSCYYGLIFNVFDKNTFIPWRNQIVSPTAGLYGSNVPCPTAVPTMIYNFEFPNTMDGRNRALGFLRQIPDGDYVVLRNQMTQSGNQFVADWINDEATYGTGNSMYTELKTQGFTDIDSITRIRAFSLVYKKNRQNEHATKFIISAGLFDPINLSVDCLSPDSIGYITSPKIGPAKQWKQIHWRGSSLDATPGDAPVVEVWGINASGAETRLIPDLRLAQQDYDISSIDAQQYRYVKLKMQNTDSTHYTPYQLRYWMLNYDPMPEGAIAPNLYFTTKDTVEVGEPFNFGIAFQNIGKVDFDSLAVKVTITDRDNREHPINVLKQKKLITAAPGDTIRLNVPITTTGLSGMNTIFVNFNPDNDQPEQFSFNNYAFRNVYVKPDSLSPLLDVTFDGVHILNRDIVAAKPAVVVKLTDEAKWMLLNDTSLLTVHVKLPNGTTRPFYFSNTDTLQFIPASQASNNSATINLKPYFYQDGEYELIIRGKDRSENTAGAVQYRTVFTVINKPMISNMLNYPNPFTTSTAFVFTLTGSEVPQNIRIQVLTITGKVVREITKDELGPLHIGRNITEFKWDGTDQYGQKLANGIYLYRVITNLNGKSLDKYTSKEKNNVDETDKYFNKGYGKMYLMR